VAEPQTPVRAAGGSLTQTCIPPAVMSWARQERPRRRARRGGAPAPRLPLMRQPRHQRGTTGEPTAPCSRYYGQHQIPGLPAQFGRTSFPTQICGYQPGQMRGAYGINMTNNGRGQTVSLVELGLAPDMFLTLQDYAQAGHFLAPSPHRYTELSLGKNTCGDPFNVEEQLDVETSYDVAPGASQLVVGGDSCNRRRLRPAGPVRRSHRDHRRDRWQPPPPGQHQLQLLGSRRRHPARDPDQHHARLPGARGRAGGRDVLRVRRLFRSRDPVSSPMPSKGSTPRSGSPTRCFTG
jgi:hypothetical protein